MVQAMLSKKVKPAPPDSNAKSGASQFSVRLLLEKDSDVGNMTRDDNTLAEVRFNVVAAVDHGQVSEALARIQTTDQEEQNTAFVGAEL